MLELRDLDRRPDGTYEKKVRDGAGSRRCSSGPGRMTGAGSREGRLLDPRRARTTTTTADLDTATTTSGRPSSAAGLLAYQVNSATLASSSSRHQLGGRSCAYRAASQLGQVALSSGGPAGCSPRGCRPGCRGRAPYGGRRGAWSRAPARRGRRAPATDRPRRGPVPSAARPTSASAASAASARRSPIRTANATRNDCRNARSRARPALPPGGSVCAIARCACTSSEVYSRSTASMSASKPKTVANPKLGRPHRVAAVGPGDRVQQRGLLALVRVVDADPPGERHHRGVAGPRDHQRLVEAVPGDELLGLGGVGLRLRRIRGRLGLGQQRPHPVQQPHVDPRARPAGP